MRIVFFLAYRFLKDTGGEKTISSLLKLCFIALSLGSFSLALVLSIARGFEQATHDKLKGINADGTIRAQGRPLNYEKIRQILLTEFSDQIAASSPNDSEQVIMVETGAKRLGHPALLKAIDPESLGSISTLSKLINAQNNAPVTTLLKEYSSVILGSALAQILNVSINDEITVLSANRDENSPTSNTKISFDSSPLRITGIIKTGIEEIDEQLALCSCSSLYAIIGKKKITEIAFSFTPAASANEEKSIALLQKRFTGLEVRSWKELYKPLVAALALERYALLLILLLICLLASMNIASLLTLYLYRKRRQSAIALAMGMNISQVRAIFIILATVLAGTASAVGTILAFFVALFLRAYPLIQLPDAYYLTTLPLDLDPRIFIGVFCLTGGLGFLISLLPTRAITSLPLGTILKREE